MSRIPIKLDENPSIPAPELTTQNRELIDSLLADSKAAKVLSDAKKAIKQAAVRETASAIEALLNDPLGLTKGDLLAVSDSEHLSSIVLRIRNALKEDNVYTLEKRGKKDSTIYYLTKV